MDNAHNELMKLVEEYGNTCWESGRHSFAESFEPEHKCRVLLDKIKDLFKWKPPEEYTREGPCVVEFVNEDMIVSFYREGEFNTHVYPIEDIAIKRVYPLFLLGGEQ